MMIGQQIIKYWEKNHHKNIIYTKKLEMKVNYKLIADDFKNLIKILHVWF